MSDFTDGGEAEGVKLIWHTALLIGLAGAAAYNVCAWLKRRETHLAVNAIVYGAGVAYEAVQVTHHCDRG